MKKLHSVLALAILSTSLMGGVALAQDNHDNHSYVEHKEWKKGTPLKHEDWDRGEKVDYREHHLSAPPGVTNGAWLTATTYSPTARTSRFAPSSASRNAPFPIQPGRRMNPNRRPWDIQCQAAAKPPRLFCVRPWSLSVPNPPYNF